MQKNLSQNERLVSGGLAALLFGIAARQLLARRSLKTRLIAATVEGVVGAGLAYRGASGRCHLKERLAAAREPQELRSTVVVNLPVAEVAAALGVETGNGEARIFRGKRSGLTWNLELASYDAGRRTRLIATFEHARIPLLGKPAAHLVSSELRDIKALLESGEIATVAGQSEGARSPLGSALSRVATRAREAVDGYAKSQLEEARA